MQTLPGVPISLWLDSTAPASRPRLEGDVTADVAVVGGGIVGTTAALRLAEQGARVVLVEARSIGTAVTGNSTAKGSALHETSYSQITQKVGTEAARAYGRLNLDGVREIRELAAAHGIDCSLETAPNYLYTERDSEASTVEDEAEAARAAGLPVELTGKTDLPYPVAVAARLDDQIAFDSAAFTRGLAVAAEAAGAVIHEDSRVRGVSHGRECRVQLENGATITAAHVVLATQMPLLDRGLFFARLRPQASYAIAARAADAPLGMYLGIGGSTRSIRSAPSDSGERVLIVGGEGHKVGQRDGADSYRKLADWAEERFETRGFTHRWSAHDLMPPDELPMIGALAPRNGRILVATGLAKWGLAAGVAAATLLRDAIDGHPADHAEAFTPTRLNPKASLLEIVRENANVGVHFFGGRLRRRHGNGLEPGDGRVVGEGAKQVAECRDLDGQVHRVSARCTHLGCIVRWNSGDATWDCPCHGSRFEADGTVRNGPASTPLGPVD